MQTNVFIDWQVRLAVLNSLSEHFDRYLAQTDNIKTLLISLNDEVFAIREAAISIIGRLAVYNSSFIMPCIRKVLIELLTEFEYSGQRYVLLNNLMINSVNLT
jgi:FKBP12-rapamycin complex-associated protein